MAQNKNQPSLYWYDYETFGADPRRDRPVQFAGLRTDLELNVIGDPLCIYCRPADDFLPHPEACLITGITPQKALAEGLPEVEFIQQINNEFSQANTCVVGYNNIRFDDEITRFTLYRNLFDAYAREWQNGNSRWDIIDMVRLTYALRPEGIEWPAHPDGKPSFRLDQLTVANGISHEAAHDALSDVHATIALAKLIREKQPRLYDYVFERRTKQQIAQLLNIAKPVPVLHVSSMYPSELGCIALVAPLAAHPTNKNEVIVYDLRADPQSFLTLDANEMSERLFVRQDELPEGCDRLPIKTIHINKSPVVVPANTMSAESAARWKIDADAARQHLATIQASPQFIKNIQAVFKSRDFDPVTDPDFMLYGGGFFSNDDRARMELVHETKPGQLGTLDLSFDDGRLPEMLFRYRARNFPDTLNQDEKKRWNEFRYQRLMTLNDGSEFTLDDFKQSVADVRQREDLDKESIKILDEIDQYAQDIMNTLST
ncbi:MAG: exodeoxyribonuclease I [Gammaproteobacteria bacterium]|nr:exodeoxyribonuclease I [Gammaproteobacteria bacterium]